MRFPGFRSEEDRQAFLAFSTGRSRLPAHTAGVSLVLDADARRDDARLPTASTCSNAFHVPAYSSAAVLKDRMLKAIYSCRAIDNDGATQGLFGALDAAAFADEDGEGASGGGRGGVGGRGAGASLEGAGRWLVPLGPYFQVRSLIFASLVSLAGLFSVCRSISCVRRGVACFCLLFP